MARMFDGDRSGNTLSLFNSHNQKSHQQTFQNGTFLQQSTAYGLVLPFLLNDELYELQDITIFLAFKPIHLAHLTPCLTTCYYSMS